MKDPAPEEREELEELLQPKIYHRRTIQRWKKTNPKLV
jgi:hypothetical protein